MPAYAAAGAFRSCGHPAMIEFRLTLGPMLGVAECLFGTSAAFLPSANIQRIMAER